MCTVLLTSIQLEWICLHLRHLEAHAKRISRPDDLSELWNRKENECESYSGTILGSPELTCIVVGVGIRGTTGLIKWVSETDGVDFKQRNPQGGG